MVSKDPRYFQQESFATNKNRYTRSLLRLYGLPGDNGSQESLLTNTCNHSLSVTALLYSQLMIIKHHCCVWDREYCANGAVKSKYITLKKLNLRVVDIHYRRMPYVSVKYTRKFSYHFQVRKFYKLFIVSFHAKKLRKNVCVCTYSEKNNNDRMQ